jgi:hypothetical protein
MEPNRPYPNGWAGPMSLPLLFPPVSVMVAGFPCQPFSVQGYRKGFSDSRGMIFFCILDFIRKQKPRVFVLENVRGLMIIKKGKFFATINNDTQHAYCATLGHRVSWAPQGSFRFSWAPLGPLGSSRALRPPVFPPAHICWRGLAYLWFAKYNLMSHRPSALPICDY